MDSRYSYLNKLLKDEKDSITFIECMLGSKVQLPYLITKVLEFLSTDNVLLGTVTDKNRLALVRLLKGYYAACIDKYLDNDNMNKYIDAAKQEIYYMEVFDNVRVATENEVQDGASGLLVKEKYTIGEDKYKHLNMLAWTFTGKLSYYKEAGYNYIYENGKLQDNIYDLINRAAQGLVDLIRWGNNKTVFNKDMATLKRSIKAGKYKYPAYAVDEVKSEYTIKQIIYYLTNSLPRGSQNPDYRTALYIVLRSNEDKHFKITPKQKSFLRDVYSELSREGTKSVKTINKSDSQLEQDCKRILEAATSGQISSDHFALKVIDTISKTGYTKCSEKQRAVLDSALDMLNEHNEPAKVIEIDTNDTSDNDSSLLEMSNMLGSGKF